MPAASGTAVTRFGLGGWGVRRAGSFAGKATTSTGSPIGIVSGQVYLRGVHRGQLFLGGIKAGDVYQGGIQRGMIAK